MSEKGLEVLAKMNLLLEMKGMHLNSYEDCFIGKQNRLSFVRNSTNNCKEVLERV